MKFSIDKKKTGSSNIAKSPMEVLDKFEEEIKYLESANKKLVEENISLVTECKDLKDKFNKEDSSSKSDIMMIHEKLREYEDIIHKLNNENKLLKSENKELRSRALINPRKVTDEQVNIIKELRINGLSFRAIAKETGLSTCTITRALNGKYDA